MANLFTVENISKVGIIGLLLLILVTGSTGVWVWGTTYQEVKAERDEWKQTALDGLRVAREVSSVRSPILSSPLTRSSDPTPNEVRDRLQTLENLNN